MYKESVNAIRSFYWDSCVFLSAINANPDRLPVIEVILDDCDKGEAVICTSMLSVTEVAFAETERGQNGLDPRVNAKIEKLWLPPSPIQLVDMHRFIVWDAKELIRQAMSKGWSLKPADAIHLATAARMKVNEFHTYDDARLSKFSELTGYAVRPPHTDRLPFRG